MSPVANVIKLFMAASYIFNKLECLIMASLFSLVKRLLVNQELTLLKHFSGAPL